MLWRKLQHRRGGKSGSDSGRAGRAGASQVAARLHEFAMTGQGQRCGGASAQPYNGRQEGSDSVPPAVRKPGSAAACLPVARSASGGSGTPVHGLFCKSNASDAIGTAVARFLHGPEARFEPHASAERTPPRGGCRPGAATVRESARGWLAARFGRDARATPETARLRTFGSTAGQLT